MAMMQHWGTELLRVHKHEQMHALPYTKNMSELL
jgi:hypothetical protein